MISPRLSAIIIGLLLASSPVFVRAENAPPSAAENKLRESLRNTMLQLRTSENDKAVAQAALAEAEEKNKTLTDQIEKITKQLAADKAAADKSTAELTMKVEERDKLISEYKDTLEKARVEIKRISDIATTKETQRAKLEDQTIQLNRRVADQQTKNANMFRIANEILARYEKFGLGDALTAREPFTGITRVKLQSLFEEYQDKVADQRIKPVEAASSETKPAPAPEKASKTKVSQAKASEQKPKQ